MTYTPASTSIPSGGLACSDPESARSMDLVQGRAGELATGSFPGSRCCRLDRRSGGGCEGNGPCRPLQAAPWAMESQTGGTLPAETRAHGPRQAPVDGAAAVATRERAGGAPGGEGRSHGDPRVGRETPRRTRPGQRERGDLGQAVRDSVRTPARVSAGRTTVGLTRGSPGRGRGGVGDGPAGASGYW